MSWDLVPLVERSIFARGNIIWISMAMAQNLAQNMWWLGVPHHRKHPAHPPTSLFRPTITYTIVGTPTHSAVTELSPYVTGVTWILWWELWLRFSSCDNLGDEWVWLPFKPAFFAISTTTARISMLWAIIVSEWYKNKIFTSQFCV